MARRALADDAFDAQALCGAERRTPLLVDVLRVTHRADGGQHFFEQLFSLHQFERAQVVLQGFDEVERVQRGGLMARGSDDLRAAGQRRARLQFGETRSAGGVVDDEFAVDQQLLVRQQLHGVCDIRELIGQRQTIARQQAHAVGRFLRE